MAATDALDAALADANKTAAAHGTHSETLLAIATAFIQTGTRLLEIAGGERGRKLAAQVLYQHADRAALMAQEQG